MPLILHCKNQFYFVVVAGVNNFTKQFLSCGTSFILYVQNEGVLNIYITSSSYVKSSGISSTILTNGFDKPILTKGFDIPLDSANLFLRTRK